MDELMRRPLLHYILNNSTVDYALFDDELKRTIREIGVRNMYIQTRLYDLIGAFQREGISAVALKGSHLIHSIYPFGIRPIEDIDLLVERKNFEKVDEIIRSFDYEDCAVSMDLWTHLMFSNKITYINQTHPVIPIDIHFSLGPYPYLGRVSRDILQANTEIMETPSCSLTVLQPEALLVHLCLHLFQHHYDDWQVSCCDIIAVIRHHRDLIDWDKFMWLVDTNNISLPVHFSLHKAYELAELEIPTSLESKQSSRYEQWIFKSCKKQENYFDRYFLQFITTPGIMLKLQCAIKIIAPGTAFLKLNYNGSYLKYMFHILKTAVKLTTAALVKR